MKDFFADLHCHSTCSDGSKSAEELVLHAKEIGLSGLAITDHDSIEGYEIALPTAKKVGLELITGVEFSTMHKLTSIHILAYAYPSNSLIMEEFCKKHILRRFDRNQKILDLLKKHNLPITQDELLQEYAHENCEVHTTVGRPHIAMAMMKKGYVKTIQEAFKKYLGEGKSCYAEGDSFSTEQTIDLIHKAKGLAIIAHPHLVDDQHVLHDLLNMNFDGIECFYARFNRDQNERWLKIAKRKNWIVTGGSDYHGDIKPNLPLGSSYVDEEHFNILLNHFKNTEEG